MSSKFTLVFPNRNCFFSVCRKFWVLLYLFKLYSIWKSLKNFFIVLLFLFFINPFQKVLQSNFNFRLHSNYLISRNYNCLRFKIFWGGPNIFSFFCMIFNYSIWKIWCLFFSLFIKTCWGWFSTFLKYNLHWNVWSHLNI